MKKKVKVSVIGTAPLCIRCNRTYARGGDKRRIEVLRVVPLKDELKDELRETIREG